MRSAASAPSSRIGSGRIASVRPDLFQPIADAMKFILKEDFTPANVNKFYYWLAPCLAMVPAIMTIAVVPFGSTLFGVPMVIADINVGVLYVFAIASLGVYGIVIAGWSSNSKYPFLGGVRSSSQMISYELSLRPGRHPDFSSRRAASPDKHRPLSNRTWLDDRAIHRATGPIGWKWLLAIPMFISFVVFTIAIFAETNRLPFDLPEAETELVGGYHTEYGSMKFALFFLGEYAAMITGSAIIVTLFLGGWHLPVPWWNHARLHWLLIDGSLGGWRGVLGGLFNIFVFFAKVSALLLVFIWVRWTLPRFRYDQLMRLGWVFFFEIALVNIFIAAIIIAFMPK